MNKVQEGERECEEDNDDEEAVEDEDEMGNGLASLSSSTVSSVLSTAISYARDEAIT